MKKYISVAAAIGFMTVSACQQPEQSTFTANPNNYASLTCEQLKVKMDARNATISAANKSASTMTNANTAGLAVGLLVSPVIGAAIAADAQNRQNQSAAEAQQAKAEFQAMSIAGSQKGCW